MAPTRQQRLDAKQALDRGLMGILYNTLETPEQVLRTVQHMRYSQMKHSKYPTPIGKRGHGPGDAAWAWGLSIDEYLRMRTFGRSILTAACSSSR